MNEQIRIILEKAKESLDAAKLLAEKSYLDFAASRTYYAMFYTAEALLLSKGLSFSSQAAVIANYGKEFSKTRELDPKFHKYLILYSASRKTINQFTMYAKSMKFTLSSPLKSNSEVPSNSQLCANELSLIN